MNWTLFGLNPKFKTFMEKHPNKTMVGMAWALYWRFALVIVALEILCFFMVFIFAIIAATIF